MKVINIELKETTKNEKIHVQEKDTKMIIDDEEYKVIDQTGNLLDSGVIVLNCVPVKPEGREKFEDRFLNRPKRIENEQGFKAIRVCRPLDSDTYVIVTQWASEAAFRNWQNSGAYSHAHKNRGTEKGIDREQSVLKSKPYHKIYNITSSGEA